MTAKARRRRWLCPETIQTSATDCGPACLKSLLEGHRIAASYGRLREACRTDVDGSSIDTLEEIAGALGLAARQVMVPVDHLLLKESELLPAIVVVRQPSGMTHFVVAWSLHRGWVQLMDPATGRRWSASERFAEEVYTHELEIDEESWCGWAASDDFVACVRRRLAELGLDGAQIARSLEASREGGWRPSAALDAATRMVAALVETGALRRGREAALALRSFVERARGPGDPLAVIPKQYWTARPAPGGTGRLVLRGAVLVSVAAGAVESAEAPDASALPESLARALDERPARPGRELVRLLREDGLLAPSLLVSLLALAAGGVLVEALLLQALLSAGRDLAVGEQRAGALAALLGFLALLLAIELPIWRRTFDLGRRLEGRTRLALLAKLARADQRYFASRLVSDMAERCHRLHELRVYPELGAELVRAVFGVALATAGIAWIDPRLLPIALGAAAASVLIPLAAQPWLAEDDLRLRNHAGAILRFHLDALLGVVPLRAHAAGPALRAGHERQVGEWARAGLRLQRRVVLVEALQSVSGLALAALLVWVHGSREPHGGGALLLVYWGLSLPVLGQQVGACARRYPAQRSITLRFLELLGMPEENPTANAASGAQPTARAASVEKLPADAPSGDVRAREGPAAIRFEGVSVLAAGHSILRELDLEIEAGSHVAVVGPSGAGKTSLVGLLLGWQRPATGRVLVDGEELDGAALERLRGETAWVDPGVQLWNRSLLANLRYGGGRDEGRDLAATIERSELAGVLDALPDGLQTSLGEGGALVSGGEGQRVRFARATLRARPRLAILDEPFRGLSRESRTSLLSYARELWRGSTLVCVTHDVSATLAFDRVVVVEGGRIVEEGSPRVLAASASRYAAWLEAERAFGAAGWSGPAWRRLRVDRGRVSERSPDREHERAAGHGLEGADPRGAALAAEPTTPLHVAERAG